MAEELEKYLSASLPGINPLKRKLYYKKIHKLLRDPLLWLRLNQPTKSDEELSSTYAFGLTETGDTGECFRRRVRCFKESLQKTADDGGSQDLKKVLSETDRDLRKLLFPDPLLPQLLSSVNLNGPLENDVPVPLELAHAEPIPRGLVTDLYKCPGDDGWEGFITSFPSSSVGYRITSASCNCAFPICLGSIVEFRLSTENSAAIVADCSLKVLQYFPGTLPKEYASDYLQKLENMLESSDRLHRIMQYPGPFTALVNEAELYHTHQSKILAILASISDNEGGLFPNVLRIFHTSRLIRKLPQILAGEHTKEQSGIMKARGSYSRDVQNFLHLAAMCIVYYPMCAYELTSVIQGCARLASSFEREFADEASNLSQAVVNASSVVRYKEGIASSENGESITEENTSPKLLDPLLWVSCFFGESVAQPLRKLLPPKSMSHEEKVVGTRRNFENIIESLESCATKYNEKPLPEGLHKVVKKMPLNRISKLPDSNLAIRTGIVIDLYQDGVGYIALARRQGCPRKGILNQRIFTIDEKMASFVETHLGLQPLHVGDVVVFQVKESTDTVSRIVKVAQYCAEALGEDFALTLFSHYKGKEVELFRNGVAMKAILNAPQVYKNTEVCTTLIAAFTSALSDHYSSTASLKKKVLDLLKSSSFIHELIEIAPQEASNSVCILQEYLTQFPDDICPLVPTLHAMVTCLLKQDRPHEVAMFLCFLSTSSCILPPLIEIQQQPWKSIPTILTKEEWKAGSVANKAYLPVVKDRGSYSSIDEYGRTYFILLRADCHGNLASAIFRLREPASSSMSTRSRAEFEIPVCDASFVGLSRGAGHHLVYHFNMESRPIPSENLPKDSPLFKPGNLLCFSIGGRFEDDIIWATINHVDSYVHTVDTPEGLVKSVSISVFKCSHAHIAEFCNTFTSNLYSVEYLCSFVRRATLSRTRK